MNNEWDVFILGLIFGLVAGSTFGYWAQGHNLKIKMEENSMSREIDVETLAKDLHESAREAVEKGATVAATIGIEKIFKFKEWDEIDEVAREGRRLGARYLLGKYDIRPLE
jgi:hypothetical protein